MTLKTPNSNALTILGLLVPIIIALIIFFVRIETRLTRIETNIFWIMENYSPCQQTSAKDTP